MSCLTIRAMAIRGIKTGSWLLQITIFDMIVTHERIAPTQVQACTTAPAQLVLQALGKCATMQMSASRTRARTTEPALIVAYSANHRT